MKYIKQLTIILSVTLLGEVVKAILPWQIPGSIYGLILLFILLVTGIIRLDSVKETADFLVEIMPVLFIPAAVGLVDLAQELKAMLLPVLFAVGPVTFLVMIVAGKVTDRIIKKEKKDHE